MRTVSALRRAAGVATLVACTGAFLATRGAEPLPEPSPAPVPPATVPAAEPPAGTVGYAFTVGQPLVYVYELTQSVSWESAGDKLAYTTTLAWSFILLPTVVGAERVELAATITAVQATHRGPGSNHTVDSKADADHDGSDDPLLGHLLAARGALLTVVLDPRSGVVAEVRGGDEIIKRINQRSPAPFPGDPPPLDAQARQVYSPASLARQWSEMLALPPAGGGNLQSVALGPPLEGTLQRTWSGTTYTLALPPGVDHLQGQLLKDPTPVTATLTGLGGKGQTTVGKGVLTEANGEVHFTLTLNALTQPVAQQHRLAWRLRLLPQGR